MMNKWWDWMVVEFSEIVTQEGQAKMIIHIRIRRWHPRWWMLTFNSAAAAARTCGLSPLVWIPVWFRRMLIPRGYEVNDGD